MPVDSKFTSLESWPLKAFANADFQFVTATLTLHRTIFYSDYEQTRSLGFWREMKIESHQFLHRSDPGTFLGTSEQQQPRLLVTWQLSCWPCCPPACPVATGIGLRSLWLFAKLSTQTDQQFEDKDSEPLPSARFSAGKSHRCFHRIPLAEPVYRSWS